MTSARLVLASFALTATSGALLVAACNAIAGMDGLAYDLATGTAGQGGLGQGGGTGLGGTGGSAAGGGDLVFTDDELEGEFGEGTFQDTAWSEDHVGLAAGSSSGTFRSRVFDAGGEVIWNSFVWTPGGPYGKRLPDGAAAESGYRAGSVDMTDNILLWHFAGETGGLADGFTFADDSGAGHDAVVQSGAALVAGVFDQALDDDIDGYAYTLIDDNSSLNFGQSDFTFALWINTTHDCPSDNPPSGNRVYIGADESSDDQTHLWFGCTSSSSGCPNPDDTGRAGGTFCSRKTPTNDCVGYCGQTVINDGSWHHMAIVKEGHAPGELHLYVDGRPDLGPGITEPISFDTTVVFPGGTEFTVGAFTNGTFQAAGTFDEPAVWRRALQETEIAAIHARGVLRQSLRVRVCTAADCSDGPAFVGPAGDPEPFVDPPEALTPPIPTALSGLPPGRYFQYEVSFDSAAPNLEPELYAVTVRATR